MAIIRVTDRPPTCEECGAAYTEHARDCKAGAQAALDLVAMLLGLAALATLPRIKNGPLIPRVVHTRADDDGVAVVSVDDFQFVELDRSARRRRQGLHAAHRSAADDDTLDVLAEWILGAELLTYSGNERERPMPLTYANLQQTLEWLRANRDMHAPAMSFDAPEFVRVYERARELAPDAPPSVLYAFVVESLRWRPLELPSPSDFSYAAAAAHQHAWQGMLGQPCNCDACEPCQRKQQQLDAIAKGD